MKRIAFSAVLTALSFGSAAVLAGEKAVETPQATAWEETITAAASEGEAELAKAVAALVTASPHEAAEILAAAIAAGGGSDEIRVALLATTLDALGAAKLSGDEIAALQASVVANTLAAAPSKAEPIEALAATAAARLDARITAEALLNRSGAVRMVDGRPNPANAGATGGVLGNPDTRNTPRRGSTSRFVP